jgi:hypothetical protein
MIYNGRTCGLTVVVLLVLAIDCLAESSDINLQLLDPNIFGKSTKEAVVLLQKKPEGAISPETVMVDINKDRYFAATVNYPKTLTLDQARAVLNKAYKKWERTGYAEHGMGIWRNEDDKFSIQLSEDEHNIVVIYIKFSMVTDEILEKSFKKLFVDPATRDAAGGENNSIEIKE